MGNLPKTIPCGKMISIKRTISGLKKFQLVISFIGLCQKTHKLACGMNGILIEQGFLGDGESPNNRLPSNPIWG
jgi:hypothetical protein